MTFSSMKLAVPSSFELGSGSGAASGCITGVLRRILCRNLRDKRCSDEDEVVASRSEIMKAEHGVGASPGIVARLMGLESLPVLPYAQPDTICRTRSANSAEGWQGPGLLGEQRSGSGGSMLRKSQSFREAPSFLSKESKDFLVLSFGDYDECEASRLNAKNLNFGFEQNNTKDCRGERTMVEKKRLRNKSLDNYAESKRCDVVSSVSPLGKDFSGSVKGMKPNEMADRNAHCRKKLSFAQEEMEMECGSQNSSPVSVLDLPLYLDGECLTSPDSCISGCKVFMRKSEEDGSRKKVSSEVDGESKKTRKCELVAQDLSDIWAHICRLIEEDLNKSKWVTRKMFKSQDAEEIGSVVGKEIFEMLLLEAVFDLSN